MKKGQRKFARKHWDLWDKRKSGMWKKTMIAKERKRPRKNGNETMMYLQNKAEREFDLRKEEMQLKRQEMEVQKEMQLEAIWKQNSTTQNVEKMFEHFQTQQLKLAAAADATTTAVPADADETSPATTTNDAASHNLYSLCWRRCLRTKFLASRYILKCSINLFTFI